MLYPQQDTRLSQTEQKMYIQTDGTAKKKHSDNSAGPLFVNSSICSERNSGVFIYDVDSTNQICC